jgi:cbb3-type cytochrome oxidase maturation protein
MLFWILMMSIFAGFIGLGIYIYCLRKGQFDDPESIKYQLFRDDNPDN